MRKLKVKENKALRVTVTMPPSFSEWTGITGMSQFLQRHVAELIAGVTYEEFVSDRGKWTTGSSGEPQLGMNGGQLRFKKDPWEQEFIRLARWMIESKILGFSRSANPHWVLVVKWEKTGVTNAVKVLYNTRQFKHVCYDSVYAGQEELDQELHSVIEEWKEGDPKAKEDLDYTDIPMVKNWLDSIYSLDMFKAKIIARWAELSGWKYVYNPTAACKANYTFTKEEV